MSHIAVGWERNWSEFWQEGQRLVLEHHEEVREQQGRVEPHEPNVELLAKLHTLGFLLVVGARVNGELAGYTTWMLEQNVESQAFSLIRQGAIFVRPKWANLNLGLRMFNFAMGEFKQHWAPIRVVTRHPAKGRAKALASLFKRHGLLPNAIEYSCWLPGDSSHA